MENENRIWAKSIKDQDKFPITLRKHTDNVLKAFGQLENKIDDQQLKDSIKTAIELHDLGKVNSYFQIRTLGNKKYKPFDDSNNIYHSLFSALWIDKEKLKNKVGDENLVRFILSAVAYHHWKDSFDYLLRFGGEFFERLSDWLSENDNIKSLEKNLKAEGFVDEIISFDYKMLEGLKNGVSFSEYVTPLYNFYWLPKRIELDEEMKRKWILLSGFLMRSDHFASFCETEEEEHKIELEALIIRDRASLEAKKQAQREQWLTCKQYCERHRPELLNEAAFFRGITPRVTASSFSDNTLNTMKKRMTKTILSLVGVRSGRA